MFTLLVLVIVPTVLFVYEVCQIHKDFAGMENHLQEEKPANDCTIDDYKFFDEHVNNDLRHN